MYRDNVAQLSSFIFIWAVSWKKCSNELNGTGGKEKELAAPMSSTISSSLYQPAPEPSG